MDLLRLGAHVVHSVKKVHLVIVQAAELVFELKNKEGGDLSDEPHSFKAHLKKIFNTTSQL
jgi:hypothetical protein